MSRLERHPNLITKKLPKCFWCNVVLLPEEKSRDHIHPIGQGGDKYGEVVVSCKPCNTERGDITSYYCDLNKCKEMIKWIEGGRVGDCPHYYRKYVELKWFLNTLNTLKKKKDKMLEIQAKWRELEIRRLGKCYVGDLVFDI